MNLILRKLFCNIYRLHSYNFIYLVWFIYERRLQYLSQFENFGWVYSSTIFFGIFIYIISGQYKGLTRYTGSSTLYIIATRNLAMVFTVYFYGSVKSFTLPSYKWWILIWFFTTFSTGAVRFF